MALIESARRRGARRQHRGRRRRRRHRQRGSRPARTARRCRRRSPPMSTRSSRDPIAPTADWRGTAVDPCSHATASSGWSATSTRCIGNCCTRIVRDDAASLSAARVCDCGLSRALLHLVSTAGLGHAMDRPGWLPAARPGAGRHRTSSRASPMRRNSCPRSSARRSTRRSSRSCIACSASSKLPSRSPRRCCSQ